MFTTGKRNLFCYDPVILAQVSGTMDYSRQGALTQIYYEQGDGFVKRNNLLHVKLKRQLIFFGQGETQFKLEFHQINLFRIILDNKLIKLGMPVISIPTRFM